MITKLLLTLGVIMVMIMVIRGQSRDRKTPATTPPPSRQQSKQSTTRTTAWFLIGVFVILSFTYSAWQWFGMREIVTVRVINSNNGDSVSYRAYRGDVDEYGFTTTDHRSITLAQIERMEIIPLQPHK